MKKMLWVLLGMFVLAVLGCGGGGEKETKATPKAEALQAEAILVDSQGNEVGKATMEETAKGVKINLTVKNPR